MDERFIDRVLVASGILAALIGLTGWAYWGAEWSLSFLLAATWGIVNLWSLARLLVNLFETRNRLGLLLFFCLKVPVLYGLILLYLLYVPWQSSALIYGVTLPYAVIVLKALGRSLNDAMSRKGSPPASGGGGEEQDRAR